VPEEQNSVLKGVCTFYTETGTEGGFWAFQDSKYIFPQEGVEKEFYYEYEGLHILKNGDKLTIFSSDNQKQIIWSGTISLRQYPVFTENAFGLWIQADQEGVDRETWATYFFEEYPAELIPNRKP